MNTTLPTLFTATVLGLTLAACSAPAALQSSPVAVQTAAKVKPYPLDTCLVTGNDLDSMGGEIVRIYDGQQIKFCCKPCIKKFEANKPKYLAKLK